jgi:hypothetical protein
MPKKGLRRVRFSGNISAARLLIFPGFAGHRTRPSWRVLCFWGWRSMTKCSAGLRRMAQHLEAICLIRE